MSGLEVTLIVIESTGRVEDRLLSALSAAELSVTLINPRKIRDFAMATGRLAKTDAIEAAAIAHFGEALNLPIGALARCNDPGTVRTHLASVPADQDPVR